MSIDAGGTEPTGESPRPRQLDELPSAVRQRIIDWAAAALGTAKPAEIPASLTRIARFAPAKRARLAGPALAQAVQADSAFRALVAERAARDGMQHRTKDRTTGKPTGFTSTGTSSVGDRAVAGPVTTDQVDPGGSGPSDAESRDAGPGGAQSRDAGPGGAGLGNPDPGGDEGGGAERADSERAVADLIVADPIDADPIDADPIDADPIDADPIDAAARAFLLRSPNEAELLAAAAELEAMARSRARVADLEREVRLLTGKLDRAAADRLATNAGTGGQPGQVATESIAEADRLRLRLRAQGTQIRELREQLAVQARQAGETLSALTADRDRARADMETWRTKSEVADARAESAAAGVQRIREAKGDRRATSDRRLELLLSALEGAASGLRREWDLVGGGPSPADVVAAGLPRPASDAERTTDPSRLTAWVGMPGAHLIVDGYNVTKTGFGELSLSDQRDRIVRLLSALGARTSAEVTVVFDGAAVAAVRPPARGIRVLFSPPGVLADDVIRDLVRAEPAGRTVIVVSSDREVVDRAAADGARTAASSVLLAALGS
ncbi:MAG: NYN domain-containing protein [Nakamurella sp.]